MSEATVKQQWLIIHREHEGFRRRRRKKKKRNKAWGAAGGKLNFAGRGTEGIRGLGDSWEAISLASYFLTADRLEGGDTTHILGAMSRDNVKMKHARWQNVSAWRLWAPTDSWSKTSGPVRATWNWLHSGSYLGDHGPVARALIRSDTSVQKRGQMMSMWWNAPNADHLSKPEREGQRQF